MLVLNSIYDRIKEDVNKDLFYKAMRRGDFVEIPCIVSVNQYLKNRKENEQGKLPYWDGESGPLEWLTIL